MDDLWSTAGNWNGGIPSVGQDIVFNSAYSDNDSSNVDSTITINSLDIQNTWTGALTLSNPLTVTNDLTLGTGSTLNAAGNAITIGGDWENAGTFTHGNNTVTLTGTSNTITSGGDAFYGLTINGSYSLADALAVAGKSWHIRYAERRGKGHKFGGRLGEYRHVYTRQ